LSPSKTRQELLTKGTVIQQKEISTTENAIVSTNRRAKKSSYPSWGRNPFSPQAAPIRASRGPILNGIMWDREKPMAIINDNIVKVGDRVGLNLVVDIKQDKVILNDGTHDFELRLE
jgi:hypothetical protein